MPKAAMPSTAPAPRFRAASASGAAAARAALDLRAQVFRGGAPDTDRFDAEARHLTVQEVATGRTAAACRVFLHADRAAAARGYTGQFYGLRGLHMARAAPLLELGRFCIAPDLRADPDPPRLMLGRIAALTLGSGAGMLLGCTSFPGADPARHAAALGYLWRHHCAPAGQGPAARAAETVALARFAAAPGDDGAARAGVPPLLRSYLALGGWVSDHAVIDRDLDTLHVFTALAADRVPQARRQSLRALAAV